MDIFSYARLPPTPPPGHVAAGAWSAALAVCAAFGGGGWFVYEQAHVPTLVAMATLASALSVVSLWAASRTIRLEQRASDMAAEFAHSPPDDLAKSQTPLFERLVAWHDSKERWRYGHHALYAAIALSALPFVALHPSITANPALAVMAAGMGIFATLLVTMGVLDHMAIRPVVGIVARAQLARLEAGSAGETSAPRPATTETRRTRPRRTRLSSRRGS
ncbi:MAG: hypothetical protein KDA24_03675 [Deltaproteobacteria bacterium]|nr:hypothetical protein [Deltaproteobacteria bacterium]